jgi:hypothetical protein
MPWIVQSVYKRPNKDVIWHTQAFDKNSVSLSFASWSMKVCLFGRRRTENEIDELTLQIQTVWQTKEEYDEFMSIPSVKEHFNNVALYNANMGIKTEPKLEFYNDPINP